MTKKKSKKHFSPFAHENLEIKNELINYARELCKKTEFESRLSATFIYASFAEYLAENLLQNLRFFVYNGCYNQYAGILFIDERDDNKNRTLGNLIECIKDYNFPDKEEMVLLLNDIARARNNIFHNFAKTDHAGLEKIVSEDMTAIQQKTEEFLNKIRS